MPFPSHPIAASWLSWRHGRVIAYPWETLRPEMDLLAWAEADGRPLVDVAAEVSRRPEALLLGILQTEFRVLLECFLNHHDWGLDGGPIHSAPGFPRARLPLATVVPVARALAGNARASLDGLMDAVRACDEAGEDVPPESVAALLAAFYSIFPALVPERATRLVSQVAPPFLHDSYARHDPAYRAPVAEFARLIRNDLSWAFRYVLLHGSLATEDYLPGISDFDTFAILREEVAASAKQLLALRAALLEAWPCLYRIDPQQHHGVLLCAGQDTSFYPQASFPFTLFDHGRTVYPAASLNLSFAERDDSYERARVLYAVRQNYRWLFSRDWQPPSQFEAKLQVNTLLLAIALYFQRSGRYSYKKDAFLQIPGELAPEELRCLRTAEQVRARNLYRTPVSWSPGGPSADLGLRIRSFHAAVRNIPASPELIEFLGPGFWRESSAFLDRLCDSSAGGGPLSAAAGYFRWTDEPRPLSAAAYEDARRATRDKLQALDPRLELWEFGSVAHPGISDLDLLIETPDAGVPPGLNDFTPAGDPNVFQHPPSMILRRADLLDAGKLYPIFAVTPCGGNGASGGQIEFDDRYAPYQLAALVEMACCYFFRQTLASLFDLSGASRQVLLSAAGLKHSMRVLRANGLEADGLEEFVGRVGSLRDSWFGLDAGTRRREMLDLLLDAVSAELSILDALRRGAALLADCRSPLAGFPSGAIVAVLFDKVWFVTDWNRDTAFAQMLAIHRRTGKQKLIYPAEIAVLLAHAAAGSGAGPYLRSQFVHTLGDAGSIRATAALDERRRIVDDHYRFLRDSGLRWGGLPHWSFDPSAPEPKESSWIATARDLLFAAGPTTVNGHIESLSRLDDLLSAVRRHVDAQRWADAAEPLEEALRISPNNAAALYLRGVCLVAAGDPASSSRALEVLADAMDAGFDPMWSRLYRGQAYLALGDMAAARAELDREPAAASAPPAVHNTRAVLLAACDARRIDMLLVEAQRSLEAQDPAAALALLDDIQKLDPGNATANYLLAFALQAGPIERAAEAEQAYQRALDGGFDPFWVYYNRSQLRLTLGDLPRAKADLALARDLQPGHPGLAEIQAIIARREGGD